MAYRRFTTVGYEFIKDAGVITGERSMQVVRSSPGSHANDLIAGSLLAMGGFLYLPLKTLRDVEGLTKSSAILTTSVAELTKGQAELTRSQAELTRSQATLTKNVNVLTKGQATLTKNVDDLTKGQATLTKHVDDLTKGQAELLRGHIQMDAKITELLSKK
jgi:uncharacterized phage infection (PIP) family protein YhgE